MQPGIRPAPAHPAMERNRVRLSLLGMREMKLSLRRATGMAADPDPGQHRALTGRVVGSTAVVALTGQFANQYNAAAAHLLEHSWDRCSRIE